MDDVVICPGRALNDCDCDDGIVDRRTQKNEKMKSELPGVPAKSSFGESREKLSRISTQSNLFERRRPHLSTLLKHAPLPATTTTPQSLEHCLR